jgi:hypothetical protein
MRIRLSEVLSSLVLIAALAYAAYVVRSSNVDGAADLTQRIADRINVPVPIQFNPPRVMRTVYLNREGARLRAGADDAQTNQSSIVAHAGLTHADIPAFSGPPDRWNAIVKCVAALLSPYDVRVTDQRPVGDEYMMAMMGGTPSVLGAYGAGSQHRALGLSPYNGKPIEDAVVMIFTRVAKEQTKKVCETAGMEIGHAYGLDHARHCGDLMTYLPGCGAKKFTDRELACGESKDRACSNGRETQNAHAYLLELLGPRQAVTASAL